MVSPHLAPSCWAQSALVPLQPPERHFWQPFKHHIGWFPFGFACHSPRMMEMDRAAHGVCLTLASKFKPCRAGANPLSIFSLRPNFILMTNKWKHKSLKLSLLSFELGWYWALYGAKKLQADGQRQSSHSNWGHCTEGTLHCYNIHTLEANN